MEFSKEQLQAVKHNTGPMIVVAGPGSGKTTVLTHRIKYLIEEAKVKPEDILVITFTKAAAVEMQSRFFALMKREVKVSFGTFHSVFFRILRNAYNYSVDNIIRDNKKQQYVMEAARKAGLRMEDIDEDCHSLMGEIGRVKSENLDIAVYNSTKYPAVEFRKTYQGYQRMLQSEKLLDFDDMLLQCDKLLNTNEQLLKKWQQRYRYVLIDEFQDINRVQYEVIRKLALPENNIYIVGDDDQSIYGFRGSKPEIMLRFEENYPGAKKVVLDMNYRSTGNIVKAASQVICHNSKRFEKDIHTNHEAGKPVDIMEFPTPSEEYDRIVEQIRKYAKEGGSYSDIAVLFRTNAIAEPLVRKLLEYNIPFVLKDGIPNLFDHWIAKDFIAYLKLSMMECSRADFLRIMNKPLRYIGRDYITDEYVSLVELEKYYEDKPWMMERIARLSSDMRLMKGMTPYAAINFIRKGIGYDDYLKSYSAERGMEASDLFIVADEIMESVKPFTRPEEWYLYMEEYAHNLKESAAREQDSAEGITMTTMHSSKGLEYPIVYIIDANEEITPHKKSVFVTEIEEERRMFYVAMTRAKTMLHIFYARERYNKKLQVSRFVDEIMKENPE